MAALSPLVVRLARANRLIVEFRRRVSEEATRRSSFARQGHDTREADAGLHTFQQALKLAEVQRIGILAEFTADALKPQRA